VSRVTSFVLLPIFLFVSRMGYAAHVEQTEIIQLTNLEDIRHASTMDDAIVQLSSKVTECVERKLAPASECFCLYPQELSRVRSTYESTLRQHPDWKSKTVSYTQDGRTYAVSFDGLSRQLQMECPQRN